MARKVSLIVIWPSLEKKCLPYHIFNVIMSHGIILLKRPYNSLVIATRGSECENNLQKVMTKNPFPIADFDL